MIERTQPADESSIEVLRPVAPGENVVQVGEDVRTGDVLFNPGHTIRPQDIGGLLALGITEIPVLRKPRVAIVSTGDELVSPEVQPPPGNIRDINTYTIAARVAQCGAEPVIIGLGARRIRTPTPGRAGRHPLSRRARLLSRKLPQHPRHDRRRLRPTRRTRRPAARHLHQAGQAHHRGRSRRQAPIRTSGQPRVRSRSIRPARSPRHPPAVRREQPTSHKHCERHSHCRHPIRIRQRRLHTR